MIGRLSDAVSQMFGGEEGSDQSPTPREAEDPWEDLETENTGEHQRMAGTVVLPEGTFAARKLDQDGDVQFEASFDTGGTGPMDLYLVPEYFMEGYRTGGDFAADGNASAPGRSEADYEAELGESGVGDTDHGPHYVVFDNTHRGETDPDGEIRAEFDVTMHK